ncbi:hypothetical protein C8R44DRAFT_791801 [Mycena epipterygia]|nr:hypothetical protein C8R44DRAFT_791801 [Mycena epipterygia]
MASSPTIPLSVSSPFWLQRVISPVAPSSARSIRCVLPSITPSRCNPHPTITLDTILRPSFSPSPRRILLAPLRHPRGAARSHFTFNAHVCYDKPSSPSFLLHPNHSPQRPVAEAGPSAQTASPHRPMRTHPSAWISSWREDGLLELPARLQMYLLKSTVC